MEFGNNFGSNTGPNAKKPNEFDLNTSADGGQEILGYIAQPFISKFAVQSTSDGSKNGPTSITAINDVAVELYNPYTLPLSMAGYHLKDALAMDIPLDKDDNGQFLYVPAQGYLIITLQGAGGPLAATVPAASKSKVVIAQFAALTASAGGGTYSLHRPYFPRGTVSTVPGFLAEVDSDTYQPVGSPTNLFADPAVAGTVTTVLSRGEIHTPPVGLPVAALGTGANPGMTPGTGPPAALPPPATPPSPKSAPSTASCASATT